MSNGNQISTFGKNLEALIKDLDPRATKRALKNTLRQEARAVRRVAVADMKKAQWHRIKDIAKAVRAKSLRDLSGYVVSVSASPKTNRGMTRNSRGQLKPLAMWVNTGTQERSTARGYNRGAIGSRKVGTGMFAESTDSGRDAAVGYLQRAERSEMPRSASRIGETFRKKVEQQIKKYGL